MTRNEFYKVGSEAIGILLDRKPDLIQKILLLIDRNLDRLDQVFSLAEIESCSYKKRHFF